MKAMREIEKAKAYTFTPRPTEKEQAIYAAKRAIEKNLDGLFKIEYYEDKHDVGFILTRKHTVRTHNGYHVRAELERVFDLTKPFENEMKEAIAWFADITRECY